MRLYSIVPAALILTATISAHADTYNYTFTETQPINAISVSFDEPAILTSITVVPASDFVSSSSTLPDPIFSVLIVPLYADDCTGPPESCVEVNSAGLGAAAFFPDTNLTSVGVCSYAANGSMATLTITDLTVPSAVPEPSTFALLCTGILGLVSVARRKILPTCREE